MNILTKLASDHQQIRHLIEKVDSVLDEEAQIREKTYDKLRAFVLVHHDTEQDVLFKELVKHEQSRDKAMHLVEEHGEHKKLIEQMGNLKSDQSDWADRYKEFRHDLLHHIEEEEEDLFSISREVLDEAALKELGNDMVEATAEAEIR